MSPHTRCDTKSGGDCGQNRNDDVDDFSPDSFVRVFHAFEL